MDPVLFAVGTVFAIAALEVVANAENFAAFERNIQILPDELRTTALSVLTAVGGVMRLATGAAIVGFGLMAAPWFNFVLLAGASYIALTAEKLWREKWQEREEKLVAITTEGYVKKHTPFKGINPAEPLKIIGRVMRGNPQDWAKLKKLFSKHGKDMRSLIVQDTLLSIDSVIMIVGLAAMTAFAPWVVSFGAVFSAVTLGLIGIPALRMLSKYPGSGLLAAGALMLTAAKMASHGLQAAMGVFGLLAPTLLTKPIKKLMEKRPVLGAVLGTLAVGGLITLALSTAGGLFAGEGLLYGLTSAVSAVPTIFHPFAATPISSALAVLTGFAGFKILEDISGNESKIHRHTFLVKNAFKVAKEEMQATNPTYREDGKMHPAFRYGGTICAYRAIRNYCRNAVASPPTSPS